MTRRSAAREAASVFRRGLDFGLASALALGLGCAAPRDGAEPPDGGPGDGHPAEREIENADGCRGLPCGDRVPCAGGARCLRGVCIPDRGACIGGDECSDDQRCYAGACVPFEACSRLAPIEPRCLGGVFPPDQFLPPTIGCHLRDLQVMSTPVVADLDGDGKPEVVATAFPDQLVALRPSDCSLRFQKKGLSLLSTGQAQVAVADLDADGDGEIVTLDAERRLLVFDHRGELLARAPAPVRERNPFEMDLWSAPTIAEVDGVAPPEIVAGAQVARFVPGPPGRIELLWTHPNVAAPWGSVPVVVDLDGDGVPEVLSSDRIYDGRTGADKTPEALSDRPFYAQVADFTGDGRPDLLLVESDQTEAAVRIFDYARRRTAFGPFALPPGPGSKEGTWGGPSVIADFDHDGVPDFGVASARRVTVYALRCAVRPKPRGCTGPEPGVLWSRPIDDYSSGSAGAAALDLNGDGFPELVHRDECWLRIFSGLDGRVVAARTVMSSTGIELPVLADADGDGHADLVVSSDVPNDNFGACMRVGQPEADTRTPWGGIAGGLLVLRDPMNRWSRTRAVWNQHAYHITNIADDLSVPVAAPAFWATHNSFRANAAEVNPPGRIDPKPDLTGRFREGVLSPDCRSAWRLAASICNRGGAPSPGPSHATFYDGDPRSGGRVLCSVTIENPLVPGECVDRACDWAPPEPGPRTLYLRVGDDGQGGRDAMQCSTENDLAVWRTAVCSTQPG